MRRALAAAGFVLAAFVVVPLLVDASGGAGGGAASKLGNPTVITTDSATAPVGGTIRAGNATGGTANVSGGTLALKGGQSTGNGNSEISLWVAPAGSSGATGVNAPTMILQANENAGNTIASQSAINVATAGVWRFANALVPSGGITFAGSSQPLNVNGNTLSGLAAISQNGAPATFTARAGGGQGSATVICQNSAWSNVNTVATAADSVRFVGAGNGLLCWLRNTGANAMALFPASGEQICMDGSACLTANTSTSVAANTSLMCWPLTSTSWSCK